jgi:hypothetical protein
VLKLVIKNCVPLLVSPWRTFTTKTPTNTFNLHSTITVIIKTRQKSLNQPHYKYYFIVEVEEKVGTKIKVCVPLTESNVKCLLGESVEFLLIEMMMDLRVGVGGGGPCQNQPAESKLKYEIQISKHCKC